jgi:hypothetical protein
MTRNVECLTAISIQQFVYLADSASYRIYSKVMNFDVVNAEFIITLYTGQINIHGSVYRSMT